MLVTFQRMTDSIIAGHLLPDDAGLVVRAGLHGIRGVHHARVPKEALRRDAHTGKIHETFWRKSRNLMHFYLPCRSTSRFWRCSCTSSPRYPRTCLPERSSSRRPLRFVPPSGTKVTLHSWLNFLHCKIQGDTSGRTKPIVDMNTKVAF